MSLTELGMLISFAVVAVTMLLAIFVARSKTAARLLLAAMVIAAIAFVAIAFFDMKTLHEDKRAALDTIEDTHGVTIDRAGRYAITPSDWMIDGIWRECYLSDDDFAHAAEADLMCETPVNVQAPYTKIGATE